MTAAPLRLAIGGSDLLPCSLCSEWATAGDVALINEDGDPVCAKCSRRVAPGLSWCAEALATLRATLPELNAADRAAVLRVFAAITEEHE